MAAPKFPTQRFDRADAALAYVTQLYDTNIAYLLRRSRWERRVSLIFQAVLAVSILLGSYRSSDFAWSLADWQGVCALGAIEGALLIALGMPATQKLAQRRNAEAVGA